MPTEPLSLLQLPARELNAVLAAATDREKVLLRWRLNWMSQVAKRPNANQLPPAGDWFICFWMTGRGYGKTLAAAHATGWDAAHDSFGDPNNITHVVAPTSDDHRKVTFDGPTGLLNVIPPELIYDYNKGTHTLVLDNGSKFLAFSAEEPNRLRGPQCKRAWGEEVSSWKYDEDTWDQLIFGTRLGRPRIYLTSTPKPRPLVQRLVKHDRCVVVRGALYENKDNLADEFVKEITKYEGTRLGRQEIYGELLDLAELGIIPRSSIKQWPASQPMPEFNFIVLSLDTAFTEKTIDRDTFERDPTGCTVWGVFYEKTLENSYGARTEKKALASVMLLDAWQDMLGFPELVARVKRELKATYGAPTVPAVHPVWGASRLATDGRRPDLVVIEDIGSGKSLRQQLEVDGIGAYPYNPGRADKLARLHIVSPLFARGRVWAPESPLVRQGKRPPGTFAGWVEPVLDQVCFYAGEGSLKHDEFVDTTSQALRVLMDFGILSAVDEKFVLDELKRKAEGGVKGVVVDEEGEYSPLPNGHDEANPYAS